MQLFMKLKRKKIYELAFEAYRNPRATLYVRDVLVYPWLFVFVGLKNRLLNTSRQWKLTNKYYFVAAEEADTLLGLQLTYLK